MTRREAADILLRCLDVIDFEDYAELIPGEHKAMELAYAVLMGEGEDESDT
jgi:hypothetical protein